MARATPGLPSKLTLPSGRKITLRISSDVAPSRRRGEAAPLKRAPGAPLFSEVLSLFDDGVVLVDGVDVRELPLGDFHVLRAVLTKSHLVHEEPVELGCSNCQHTIRALPCENLELGPWVDAELDDPELDATAKLGEPHDVPPIALGRVREARTITFVPRTVAEAKPLFEALASDVFDVTPAVVRAMGIAELGPEKDAEKIAEALTKCDDDAFAAVTDTFLECYYPLRLGSAVFCVECKARNDVDAPFEREFEPDFGALRHERGDTKTGEGEGEPLPSFDAFAERAHAIAEPMLAALSDDSVELVIDGGFAAVDDGGAPLLGSYEPPPPRDAAVVQSPPRVTVYYRTFRAIEDEEGRFDWEAELRETIEHELEHHVYFLTGDDPMDAQERDDIDREAMRIVGRKETERRAMKDFGRSLQEFLRRAWPLLVFALIAVAIALASQR